MRSWFARAIAELIDTIGWSFELLVTGVVYLIRGGLVIMMTLYAIVTGDYRRYR